MRIGIDMLAVQSPGSRGRGVGRYARSLVEQMLREGREHEFLLYAHTDLPTDQIPESPGARVLPVPSDPDPSRSQPRHKTSFLSRSNQENLDVLLTLNPFELVPHYDPAPRPARGPAAVAVVYDLIPFLFPEKYLDNPVHARWMCRRLDMLRSYDLLLTISEATRADCLRLLGLDAKRVRTISGAVDAGAFPPDRSFPLSQRKRGQLSGLGIRRPYLYSLGGIDWRKNVLGLIEAFSLLPREIQLEHDLVITCALREESSASYRAHAELLGIGDRLVLTGEVPEETLRLLYQRCKAFVFPSLYEGLGLPILEAMQTGTPVVAGDNSSQVEVVGDAGLLANAKDPQDLSAKIARVLGDPDFASLLGRRGRLRASFFTWKSTARRALGAIEEAVSEAGPRPRLPRSRTKPRPRLAIFSPWPPKASGISDYSARLLELLAPDYAIDLYHEPGYVPHPALASADYAAFDHRLYPRMARERSYRGLLHQMGNSFYHRFMYEDLAQFGGIVTLHDFNLAGFQWWRAHTTPDPLGTFAAELGYCYPDRSAELLPQLGAWAAEPGGMQEACVKRRLTLNRRIFACAEAVIVHSPWCLEQVRASFPEYASKTFVVAMEATPEPIQPGRRSGIRSRFGIPEQALAIGCFGILSQSKMNVETIEAFAAIKDELPGALLLFVGQDWENGQAQAAASRFNLQERVRFLGRQSHEDFQDLIACCDLGISLRRQPTYGETSAALLQLLRHGLPTIASDADTFSDYPGSVVRKVSWEREGLAGLIAAVKELGQDPRKREQLGRSGKEYVARWHNAQRVASQYKNVIETVFEIKTRARPEIA